MLEIELVCKLQLVRDFDNSVFYNIKNVHKSKMSYKLVQISNN